MDLELIRDGKIEAIEIDNNVYLINKTDEESREVFLKRCYYIIRKMNEGVSYDLAVQRSYVWRNMEVYKMKYPSSVTKHI